MRLRAVSTNDGQNSPRSGLLQPVSRICPWTLAETREYGKPERSRLEILDDLAPRLNRKRYPGLLQRPQERRMRNIIWNGTPH